MRDDTSDPRDMRDPNHIWLRQSVTFAVNGQTRTLELALPLRPGATPEEVESLLDEAEAGMRRLSRRLDAHLAEIIGAAQPTAATPPMPAAAPEATPAPQPAAAPAPRHSPAPQPAAPAAAQASIAERPAPRPAAPATPPRVAPPTPPAPPAASAPAASAPAAPTSGGPDLTRAEFLTAAGALGLDARTVMERLNVRTLSGLNLREALDLLRRQLVREGGAPAAPPAAAPAAPAMPAPIGRARFDEEDDGPEFELSYPDPEELPSEDEYAGEDEFAPLEVAPTPPAPSAALAGPLDDVPDLADLLGAPAAAPAATPATPAAEPAPVEEPVVVRAREMIATLRATHAGGQPTERQRTAYKNVVIDQIGETKAAGVARAVWSLTPERLGPDQIDALIYWGKADAFAEEVEAALALLRAEYLAQKAQQTQQAQQEPPAPAAPTRRATQRTAQTPEQPAAPEPAARPAPRGRPAAPRGTTRNGSPGGA